MKNISLLLLLFVFCAGLNGRPQATIPVHPTLVTTGTFWGVTKPLRDLPVMTKADFRKMARYAKHHELNESLRDRSYPFAATALPKGPDPFFQNFMGTKSPSNGPIVNFDGQVSPYYPPDCNGVAGHDYFFQTINTVYAIYTKTGTLVAGPTNINLIFGSVPGSNRNDGDPIVLYDRLADRWLVTEFSLPSGQQYMMMAVSTTNDPTGTYYQYSFPVATLPDYPKFGVWGDGYYMGDNNGGSTDTYVFQRSQMLIGATALMVGFMDPYRPQSISGFMCVPPLTNDGNNPAPAGSPGLYIAFNDDAVGGGLDQLWIYELHVDWTAPANSTFNRTQQVDVAPFSSNFGNTWSNIIQKGTSQKLDAICENIMNVPQYRNFGSYQTIVCTHTVNLGTQPNNNKGAIRWYELRRTTGNWSIRQQGTYSPDTVSRWLGSIMLNGNNKIAVGYSVSGPTEYPGIRYCGQSPAEYNNASGILDIEEDTIWVGANSQSGINRWGDYSGCSVDPADDETFWFTNQYIGGGGSRMTRIASFKFITGPLATTMPASDVTGISATLNGTVNPQGLATSYHFEYGTVPFNLSDSTQSDTAGSGNTAINVSAVITSLLSNKTYFFRCVATNAQGSSFGSVLNFTTGQAPLLVVNPPNQNVGTPADSTQFTVTSNIDWLVSSDAPWCAVTPAGVGNGTITANYAENLTVVPRVANITVTGTGVSPQVVTVSQSGIPLYLNVTPPNQNVTPAPDSTGFSVTSNTSWSVSSDASWCTVATLSGAGNGHITANYAENMTLNPRVANITVTGTGVGPQTVTITQSASAPMLAVNPPNQNVIYTAGNTSFTVTSNLNWSVQSDSPWCTVTPSGSGNGTIIANFGVNPQDQQRVANIQVSAPSVSTQTVTVTQAKSSIGIDEKTSVLFRIYPNPTKGIFRIVPANNNKSELDMSILDPNGQKILHKLFSGDKEYLIDLSSTAIGCYYVKIKSAEGVQISKLIILK